MSKLDKQLIDEVRYGHEEGVRALLAAGANVNAENDMAIRAASYNGHAEIVKILLEAGANVSDAAIRLASTRSCTDVVKLLKAHIAKEKPNAGSKTNEELLTQLQEIGKELEKRGVKFALLSV